MLGWSRFGKRLALAAGITLLVAGCTTTKTDYTAPPLPLPDRPSLPLVPAETLECLTDEDYEALAVRDAALQQHIRRLEAIIRTTHR